MALNKNSYSMSIIIIMSLQSKENGCLEATSLKPSKSLTPGFTDKT